MTQTRKAKRFVYNIWCSLFVLIFLYTFCYHFLGNKVPIISHSYKQFLLQHTEDKRLIIDSGSNSLHGINCNILEKELGVLTINLSDNASYPLNNKLLRIEQYSHTGDILLLPLEWIYYTYTEIPKNFLDNIIGNLNYYYFYGSLVEEIEQMWGAPFVSFTNGIDYHINLMKNKNEYIEEYINKFNNGERGSFVYTESYSTDKNVNTGECDSYIFGEALNRGLVLSKIFKKNVKTVKRMQKTGIKVFFTWPIAVGDDCYSNQNIKKIDQFISIIKDYMHDNELSIIGDPYENKFFGKDMLDTHYHIIPEARDLHTKRLVEEIKQSISSKWFKQNQVSTPSLNISLEQDR